MTIIAYRDGIIAADTLVQSRDLNIGHATKIAKNKAGDVAGATGDSGWCSAFLTWFTDGEEGPMPTISYADLDACDIAIVVRVTAPSEVWSFPSCKYPSSRITIGASGGYAIGSARAEAMGAMFAGADALKAVDAGIALDSGCGGRVDWQRLGWS